MNDIYRDGTYARNNPSLHEEDSAYKFRYIRQLLEQIDLGDVVRILDVGGGAGVVAALTCNYLDSQGIRVECHAYDLSPEMLLAQRANNPYVTLATSDFEDIRAAGGYDLVFLVDVIEHIPDNGRMADEIDRLARFLVYNIPTERNVLDWLRNKYMGGRYYAGQAASLGHIHFFSAASARAFVRAHHRLRRWVFPDFCGHVMTAPHPDYVRQRESKPRRAELLLSGLVYKYLRPLAPYLIQGSLFILAEGRGGRA